MNISHIVNDDDHSPRIASNSFIFLSKYLPLLEMLMDIVVVSTSKQTLLT
jgi:hypothetical protein